MEKMRRIGSLLMALVIVLSLSVTAFAASGVNGNTGEIIITNALVGSKYEVYQILKLESYDTEAKAYVYTANPTWKTWVEDATAGGQWFTTASGTGYVTLKESVTNDESTAKAIAKAVLTYAKANSIAPVATQSKVEGDGVNYTFSTTSGTETVPAVKFTGLNLGYYVVDSSLGSLLILNTTNPQMIVEEKNKPTTQDKKVEQAAGNGQFVDETTYKVGDSIRFAAKISTTVGAENIVYHDIMQDTLDLDASSFKVYMDDPKNGVLLTAGTDYTVTVFPDTHTTCCKTGSSGSDFASNPCTFHVAISQTWLDTHVTTSTDITIAYSATLNSKAVIGSTGNTNDSTVSYGNGHWTTDKEVKVKTYAFSVTKIDSENNLLEGAEFDLYREYYTSDGHGNSVTNYALVPLVEDEPTGYTTNPKTKYYRPATEAEQAAAGFTSAKITCGHAVVWGVRSGVTMDLKETKAPVGYNAHTDYIQVGPLSDNNLGTVDYTTGVYVAGSGGTAVVNLTGAQLPTTGGMGTTLFYIFGGLLASAAVVLLVTKKRMSA